MNTLNFDIMISCPASKELLSISNAICKYFLSFFNLKVFQPKKIIIGNKSKVVLALFFVEEGRRYTSREILLAKGTKTISTENIKMYELLIPLILIKEADDYQIMTIKLIYEAIGIFLTSRFKAVSMEFLHDAWKEVNIDYLRSELSDLPPPNFA